MISDVFIVDLFYFPINKIIIILLHRIKHFTGMPEYTKYMILNTLHVFYIHTKNNVHPFSIFYNLSMFPSLWVRKCVA